MTQNTKTINVLIIDDQRSVALAIETCFGQLHGNFDFKITKTESVEEYIEKYVDQSFDVYVIDLQLKEPEFRRHDLNELTYSGNFLIELASSSQPQAVIAVYSAYNDPDVICWAGNHGANIFVHKGGGNVSAKQLVQKIERRLLEMESRKRRIDELNKNLSKHPDWLAEHAGNYVVFENDEIIASNPNRLRTLLHYRQLAEEDESLPSFPIILRLPETRS